jgi:hypothetical protein
MDDFDAMRPRSFSGPALRRVRTWAEQALNLPEGYMVLVTELRCSEEGCPPIETVIVIVGGPEKQRQGKIACPAEEVSRAHVEAVCAALRAGSSADCGDCEIGFTD